MPDWRDVVHWVLERCLDMLVACAVPIAVVAPAAFGGLLLFWRFLDVPEVDGRVARISRRLGSIAYACLGFLCLLAPFCGDVVRAALLMQVIVALVPLAYTFGGVWTRKCLSNTYFIGPLLWRYVAADIWAKHTKMSPLALNIHFEQLHEKYAPVLFKHMVDQGGLYVKFGQFLSIFPDGVIPKAYMDQFQKLQKEVTPLPIEEVRELVKSSYGRPLEEVFSSFDAKPIGTASIGQVHKATLRSDGSQVAVKVQLPNVKASVLADLFSLRLAARFLIKELRPIASHGQDYAKKEFDFQLEAKVLSQVHRNLRDAFPEVNVPKPVEDLCTPEIVVMSFIPGTSLLQAMLRMASAVLGKTGTDALRRLIDDPDDVEDNGGGSRALSLGALGAAIVSAVLAWRRRRTLRRLFRRAVLASSATTALVVAGLFARRRHRGGLLSLLPSLVRLLNSTLASSRAATNVAISVYNSVADKVGMTQLRYRKEIPKFDPLQVASVIWQVQGHQLFVDRLFNSDAHPGNFLIDEKTGSVGLIDFGQAGRPSLRSMVLFAREIVALAGSDEREIALRHAHMGFKTKRMSVAVLAAHARVKFGHLTLSGLEGTFRHFDKLNKLDPVFEEPSDAEYVLMDRMIALMRGTTAMLGVPLDECCPPVSWLPYAQALLAKHDREVEEPDFNLSDLKDILPSVQLGGSHPEPGTKGGFAIG